MTDMSVTGESRTEAFGAMARDPVARQLRGFGVVGWLCMLGIYAASLLLPGSGAVLVIVWAWRSRTPWRDLGLARPPNWLTPIAIGIALGLALRLLTKFLIMPILGAPPNPAFHHLEGNAAALPMAILLMGFVAAFGEEIVMRGYLFDRLRQMLGRGTGAMILMVLGTSLLFGIGHYQLQGAFGAVNATMMGIVFATLYLLSGRLWLPIACHATNNLAGLAIIYLGL
jgi:membrane protease YdiL (CAAX protease family)